MTPEKIGPEIEIVNHLTFELKEKLKVKHNWDDDDARYTLFNKLKNILDTASISYLLLSKYLSKKDWWLENENLGVNEESMIYANQEFEMSIRINLIQNVTYAIESSFRTFSRSAQPGACKNGLDSFYTVYSSLLKKTSLQKHEKLLDLFRTIRNTMHNNGLFMSKNGRNEIIKYQNIEYVFEDRKHCEFVDTIFVIKLIANLVVFLHELMESKEFTSIDRIAEES